MPNLAVEDQWENGINNDTDLRKHPASVLSLSSVNISSAPSIINFRVSSPAVSHALLPNDLPDLSAQDTSISILPDSSISPQESTSLSLVSSSSSSVGIVDDLNIPDLTNTEMKNIKSHVTMDEDALKKEVQEILRGPYAQQQIRGSICSIEGDFDLISQIRVPRKRSIFVKKIPFCQKFRKSDTSDSSLKPFEIYKFADKIDILLMIIGSIAAIGVGACYPIMLLIYKSVLNNLITNGSSHSNTTLSNSSSCVTVVNNTTATSSSLSNMDHIVKYYILLGFANILLSWAAWSTWIVAAERQVRRIRFALFRNILRQEIGWFDLHNTGELSNRLIDDLDRMKDGMSEKVPDFISLVARMLGSLIYAFVSGWKLSLVYLSISPLIIIAMNLTIRTIVKFTTQEVQAFASASSIVQEVLQNIRTVTAFHGQEKEKERFANSLTDVKATGIRKGIYVGMCQGLTSICSFSATSLTLWYGVQLTRTDCSNYSTGTIFVVMFACMNATMGISQMVPNIQNFAEAAGCGSFVFDIIERKTEIDASSDEGDKPQTVKGDIEFDNVSFTYPARQEAPVLQKLSLKIPSGKTVALVGSSGCGKSTVIQLIQRFYDPDNGRVLLDGKNITTLNVGWLRSQIGIVSQEPVLFTGTIEDNIRLGNPDATDEEVQTAAEMANAHDFIMALPQKYKTPSGDKLSGGQKQRVAIARALISNPKILLLDEATSALDNTSERVVQDALDKAKQGRTTLVIAHRLTTIRNADLIIGLENGQVKEHGTHDELMKEKGLYYELVTAQTQNEKEDDSDSETESDDNKDHYSRGQQTPNRRRGSKQSMSTAENSDESDGKIDEALSNDLSTDNKWFRVPFLYKIAKFNIPEWYWILLGTFVSIGFGATQPLYGLIFANFYGAAAETDVNEQNRLIRNYAIICFCIGLAGGLAQFLTSLSFAKSGEALTMRMRKLTFSAILRQEMDYFDYESNSVGALVTRLSSDASALKGLTGIRIGIVFQSIGAAVTGLSIGFSVSWKLSLVALCFAPVVFISTKLRAQKSGQTGQKKEKPLFAEEGGQYATQAIEHIRTVVGLHQENRFVSLYEDPFNQQFKKDMCNVSLLAFGAALSNSMVYFIQCACFGYGSKLIDNGELQFAQVYRVFGVMSMCIFTVCRSMTMVPDYAKGKAGALRIMKLYDRQSKIDPNDQSGIILNDVVGKIEFHDVYFRYPSRPTVRILKHFSLKCVNGNTTALVGPSGSGKSTLIALLQRFYDPTKGKVLLDGHDIKVLNIQWLRSMMGLVQQEPVLFNLSIRDNIAYGDNSRQVTQDEIEGAARMANIHELIISLPEGYDTMCGAKGSQLSGGQKQRIAIARALIRNPKMLLLDEATSALDNKSEKVVQATLDQARLDRTCLTIAHRLSAIQHSDKIAVVNRGKMREEGTHEELLKQKGIYAKLTLAQRRSIIHR